VSEDVDQGHGAAPARLTNNSEPGAGADISQRRHAIIESVFADLIDGLLAHLASGRRQPPQ
jgi:hypothetical protein